MKVLVIEDSIDNLEIVTLILETMGYEVITAENGQDGYEKALKSRPSLIVTDYHLPGLSGIEIVKKIRLSDTMSRVPVIAMTADIYAKNALLTAGCDAYLVKPIRRGTLLRTINQVLLTAVS